MVQNELKALCRASTVALEQYCFPDGVTHDHRLRWERRRAAETQTECSQGSQDLLANETSIGIGNVLQGGKSMK